MPVDFGRNTFRRLIIVSALAIAFIGCAAFLLTSARTKHAGRSKAVTQAPKTSRRQERTARRYQEVYIPFVISDNKLITTVTIRNRRLPAIVDTGTALVVASSHTRLAGTTLYQIAGRRGKTMIKSIFLGPDGTVLYGRMKRLPGVGMGRYLVKTADSVELDHFNNSPNQDYVVLGNDAFLHVVLTIDVQKKEMIVRTKEFDVTQHPLKPGNALLDFTYTGKNLFSPGVPVIAAQVDGYPVHLILDTGLDRMLLTQDTAHRLPVQHQLRSTLMTGPFSVAHQHPSLSGVSLSLGKIKLADGDAVLMRSSLGGTQGSIGMPLLRACRVTIDYPGRKILLEPIGSHH